MCWHTFEGILREEEVDREYLGGKYIFVVSLSVSVYLARCPNAYDIVSWKCDFRILAERPRLLNVLLLPVDSVPRL